MCDFSIEIVRAVGFEGVGSDSRCQDGAALRPELPGKIAPAPPRMAQCNKILKGLAFLAILLLESLCSTWNGAGVAILT